MMTIDTIDTRELVERLDEINDSLEEIAELVENGDTFDYSAQITELEEEKAEIEEVEGYCEDFLYGATLIRESDFKEYAQQFADEIGAVDFDGSWPNSCIDWDQAARELAMDYTLITYQGIDYYVR